MTEVRDVVQSFIEEALEAIRARGSSLNEVRGIALHDGAKDEQFTSLQSFEAARIAVASLPDFDIRFGTQEAARATLQVLYVLLDRQGTTDFVLDAFEAVWSDLTAEVAEPIWTYRGVSNVTNIDCEVPRLDLGEGVSIRHRSFDRLADLGFNASTLEALRANWGGFGSSSFVAIVESQQAKSPDTAALHSDGEAFIRLKRALLALRLLGPGAIGHGTIWYTRADRFNFGLGGALSTPITAISFGAPFHLSPDIAAQAAELAARLSEFDAAANKGPGNVELALRSFMTSYDRGLQRADSLIDLMTSLEALLGTSNEITYRLSVRAASLLADPGPDRAGLFREVGAWYRLRSTILHGSQLKPAQNELLGRLDDLRALVRRVLLGFLTLWHGGSTTYDGSFFNEELDACLLDPIECQALREAMGLAGDTRKGVAAEAPIETGAVAPVPMEAE